MWEVGEAGKKVSDILPQQAVGRAPSLKWVCSSMTRGRKTGWSASVAGLASLACAGMNAKRARKSIETVGILESVQECMSNLRQK